VNTLQQTITITELPAAKVERKEANILTAQRSSSGGGNGGPGVGGNAKKILPSNTRIA